MTKLDDDSSSPGVTSVIGSTVHPVDELLPIRKLLPFAIQHVMVMAASPITAVFLIGKSMNLPEPLIVSLISATFFVCGVGTLVQSFGPFQIGARLPFVMVPGGAPVVIFLLIAKSTNLRTASGAVILAGLTYLLVLPVFTRLLRFFPRLVIGTILLLVSINLVKIFGGLISGRPGTPHYGDPANVLLALVTIGFILAFARLLRHTFRQLAVLFGLLAGVAVALLMGRVHQTGIMTGPVFALPTVFPFGLPQFNLLASLPLILFSVVSMGEATGQTAAVAEAVGRPIELLRQAPRTIRGDAVISLLGACLGTSLIITSDENVGIVRATGVRSRFVTATGGIILILVALITPIGRLISAIPAPVIAGTAAVVFTIIGVMGIEMLRKVDLGEHGNLFALTGGLAMGLLPTLDPGLYVHFPSLVRDLLGNGLAAGFITAVVLNFVFHHVGAQPVQKMAGAPHSSASDATPTTTQESEIL